MLSIERLHISWQGAQPEQARQLVSDLARCLADLPLSGQHQIPQLQIGPLTLSGNQETGALAQQLATQIAHQINNSGGKA